MTEKDWLPDGRRIKLNARYIGMYDEGYFLELDKDGYALVAVPSINRDANGEVDLIIYQGWLSLKDKQIIFHPLIPIDENEIKIVHTVGKKNSLVRKLLNSFEENLENAA